MKALLCLIVTAAVLAPPAGRPPMGPLQRFKPRLYDITYGVTISTHLPPVDVDEREEMVLENVPIVMPVILQSTFSQVDPESLGAHLWLENKEDRGLAGRSRLDDGFPFNTHLAVLPLEKFRGQMVRWQIGYRAKVWSSRIDDAAAAQIAWPREWPREVRDGLEPQLFIESDHPMFQQAVEQVSGGNLRLVPPYLAAKDLVRFCINSIQVSGDGIDMRAARLIHGLEIKGAVATANSKVGGPHDLVCVCVAMLRAAGIPARPVIGIYEKDRSKTRYVSWAEFYLPDAGWVPFDPNALRGKGIRHKDVTEPWSEFGTMKNLNLRVPLAFHFLPPAQVESPQAPALWGWAPTQRPRTAEQYIALGMTSRGKAPDDPAEPDRGR